MHLTIFSFNKEKLPSNLTFTKHTIFWPKIKNIGQNMITSSKEARNKLHIECSIRYLEFISIYILFERNNSKNTVFSGE